MTSSNDKSSKPSSCKEVACNNCDFSEIQDVMLGIEDVSVIAQLLKRRQQVPKGEGLFRAGQPFHAAYAVKSGTFMSYRLLEGGEEQVLGFHFPGELVGLDAIKDGQYSYSAKALEAGSICELYFNDLALLGDGVVDAQKSLLRAMGGQINQAQRQSLLAARQAADERIAAFLLNISERFNKRDLCSTSLRLAMSRQHIASYLGVAVETISRGLKRFQTMGLLKVSGKQIELLDKAGLENIARVPPSSS
ncbi:helix-turn-helix domain-containing protein [Pseudomonadota bacterium]